jgi:DNA-directed RNA polymerase subunit K/omega
MSDEENNIDSEIESSDSETETDIMGLIPKKKVILPNLTGGIAGSDDEEEEEDDAEEEDDEEEDEDDDVDYDEETAADVVFTTTSKKNQVKSNKKSRNMQTEQSETEIDIANYDAESDGDYEDDDEDGEKYLQKFDEFTKQNIVEHYHPELQQHNHDEIDTMTVVVRDAEGIIIDPLHRTLPFLTKYEKARILGERAKQIDAGARPFIEIDPSVIDGYLIALAELEQKKIPFIIKRPLVNGGCEYWKLKDLEFL